MEKDKLMDMAHRVKVSVLAKAGVDYGSLLEARKESVDYVTWAIVEQFTKHSDPDYWTRLEHQAAIAAMQGILSNPAFPEHSRDGYYKKNVVNNAYEYAHALVEKYKKEK